MQRDFSEKFMKYVFMFCALISIISILLIFYFIFIGGRVVDTPNGRVLEFDGGLPFLTEKGFLDVIFGTNWRPNASTPSFGILPMIIRKQATK